ncbi:MAP7 domain-containing protein 2 [Stomoxys calcitrans]|uniref:Protein HEXIM1 n=1 Tax=Stomoxys calcitrans TaxID=35570 RepID=A0A1I8PI52_STOCA|nr:MAP7 domain-containing protein 2 [Stomoxys calcitrans]
MDVAVKTENADGSLIQTKSPDDKSSTDAPPPNESTARVRGQQQPLQQQQQSQPPSQGQQKTKRKHRRGKPKSKNVNKPYKKNNWRFQMPRLNYSKCGPGGGSGGGGGGGGNRREKLQRSRSLVPYNTNKFLMEEHLADVPNALFTPSGRTRDSSFSMDSEDNYFFSLPEDEEEFLTKEFANVYEKARVERLENLSKQELIEECLQIEDRYSKDQGNQRQQQLNVQRVASEYMAKIRALDEKVRELSRENHNLRCQLMRSAAFAAAAASASPPSAAAPIGSACQPTPMDSSSEDSESDSSSSSSTSSSSSSSGNDDECENRQPSRRRSCSSRSSLSEYDDHEGYVENNFNGGAAPNGGAASNNNNAQQQQQQPLSPNAAVGVAVGFDNERQEMLLNLADHMEDDDDNGEDSELKPSNLTNGFHTEETQSPPRANSSPVAAALNTIEEDNNGDAGGGGGVGRRHLNVLEESQ